ncbi:MAG: hypothetical protein M3422_27440, partial [Actinomycetota bacterium]|nr:hypothetical protein [Actinomycetota bacterium]
GKVVADVPTGPKTGSVQFDPAGRYVVLHGRDRTVEVRDARSWALVLGPVRLDSDDEYVTRFVTGERFLVAADNSVLTYDLRTGNKVESFRFGGEAPGLGGPPGTVHDVSGGGERVIYQRSLDTPRVVPLDPGQWQRTLCAVVGHRELSADELADLAGGAADIDDICGPGDA